MDVSFFCSRHNLSSDIWVSITTIDLEGKKAPKFNKEQKEQKMQTPKSNNKTVKSLPH